MSKAVPPQIQTMLDTGCSTLAYCWLITTEDGEQLGFTDSDADLQISNITYKAVQGYSGVALQSTASSSIDNTSVSFLLNFEGTEEDKLLSGAYDFADIEIFLVNYLSVASGIIRLKKGFIGEIKIDDVKATANIIGLTQKLEVPALEYYSNNCRATLGDSKCKFVFAASPFITTGNITNVFNNRAFNTDITGSAVNDFYKYGIIEWTSGLNIGRKAEVKTYLQTNSYIELFDEMFSNLAFNDSFILKAGCDKKLQTCKNKFNNIVNFRGEPFIPGRDARR